MKQNLATIIFCLLFSLNLKSQSLQQMETLLYKMSFDSIENSVLKMGYAFDHTDNLQTDENEYVQYFFKKPNSKSNENLTFSKRKSGPLNIFFDRVAYSTTSSEKFYALKKQLSKKAKPKSETSEDGCVIRSYYLQSTTYMFNICSSPKAGVQTTYFIFVDVDWANNLKEK